MEGWAGLSGLISGGQGVECMLWSQSSGLVPREREPRDGRVRLHRGQRLPTLHLAMLTLPGKQRGWGGPPSRALLPLELPLPSSPSPPDSKHSVIVSVKDQKPGRESDFVGWLEPLGRLKHCF